MDQFFLPNTAFEAEFSDDSFGIVKILKRPLVPGLHQESWKQIIRLSVVQGQIKALVGLTWVGVRVHVAPLLESL